jgi:tetraacyldisaccharide 4'-kinase
VSGEKELVFRDHTSAKTIENMFSSKSERGDDVGIKSSKSYDFPVICVGNLSVGGTGKTPMIEYLIRLLHNDYKIATLSRGYKRNTKGFVLAGATSNAGSIGDEPFQFYKKFPEISVAVDANRVEGIQKILRFKNPQVILLDDAFQHRSVKAGLNVLLTSFDDLFSDDWLLPVGNLREFSSGKKRAQIIVVTKCPHDFSEQDRREIQLKLKLNVNQELFFSKIQYDEFVYNNQSKLLLDNFFQSPKLLLAGIAKPDTFFNYLKKPGDVCMTYADHHNFSDIDIQNILKKASKIPIITTEKDYVRLVDRIPNEQLFYLPIRSEFLNNGSFFDQMILDYVATNTTDSFLHSTKD